MVTDYHKQIENVLIALGTEWKNARKIKKVCQGNEHPLSIVDPRSKRVVNYQPDVYFVLRNNRKLVFEVLDSESEKQDAIIADVICSFLVENVDGLIFIHPGPERVEDTVNEALVTIYKGLINKGIPESELPNFQKTGAYLVTKQEGMNSVEINSKLNRYAKENKWFKSLPLPKEKAA